MMVKEKDFLTYDHQMKLLDTDKKISCSGPEDMKILRRTGYFNLIGGYKTPFVNGIDALGKHTYLPGTGIQNLYSLKLFDDELRSLILKYIIKAVEEIRAFASYKFDEVNNNGQIQWYEISAYKPYKDIKDTVQLVELISKEYNEISRSKLNYVKVYMDSHNAILT